MCMLVCMPRDGRGRPRREWTFHYLLYGTSLALWCFLETIVRGSETSVHTGASAAWDLEGGKSDVSQLTSVQGQGQASVSLREK